MTLVRNLSTGEERLYDLDARSAVLAAYRQEHGDYNTWGYGRYDGLLTYGSKTVACGDWCALLEEV